MKKYSLLGFLLPLLITGAVTAQPVPSECAKYLGEAKYDEAGYDDCLMLAMNTETIEAAASRSDTVIRALINQGERPEVIMFIQFTRTAEGKASLDVRTPQYEKPRMTRRLQERQWRAVEAQWTKNRSAVATALPQKEIHHGKAGEPDTVCISRGFAKIEIATDSKSESYKLDGCQKEYSFIDYLVIQAIADLPDCSRSAPNRTTSDLLRLQNCFGEQRWSPPRPNLHPR